MSRRRPIRRRSSGWLGGVYSGGIEWCTGRLAAAALTCADDPPGVANARGADQAADDDKRTGHADAYPEGLEGGLA
jgi:hypothetical protein